MTWDRMNPVSNVNEGYNLWIKAVWQGSLTMPARVKTFFDSFVLSFLFSGTQLRSLRRVVLVVPLNSALTTTARA
jgi:hypothetical protein